jgi:hypothetical protein
LHFGVKRRAVDITACWVRWVHRVGHLGREMIKHLGFDW